MSDLTGGAAGLGAAASWGTGDYFGGLATRRASVWRVVLVSQTVGAALALAFALFLREAMPGTATLAWAFCAGLSGALGIVGLYSALAAGRMGIAAPITAVVGATIPAIVGGFLEGAPGLVALAGISLALPGIWLLSRGGGDATRGIVLLAVASGLGFGGFFVMLEVASREALGWPLFAARLATLLVVLAVVLVRRPPAGATPWGLAAIAGTGDTLGNVFFAIAARVGRLDVAAVLSSLYPAFTVIAARVFLKEHLTRGQLAGMALTLAAVVMITWG